ncbi:MAG: hypothetical protein ACE5GE_08730 [Phycisphaerae bacterium]
MMIRVISLLGLVGWLALNGCASGGGGSLYGGGSSSSGGGGNNAMDDTDAGGDAAAGDMADGAGGAEPDCGTVTYASFAEEFFAGNCTRCHNSQLSGGDRNGAPAGLNWDVLDTVLEFQDRIRFRAVEAQTMPPSPPFPSAEDRETLGQWIDCGAPAE